MLLADSGSENPPVSDKALGNAGGNPPRSESPWRPVRNQQHLPEHLRNLPYEPSGEEEKWDEDAETVADTPKDTSHNIGIPRDPNESQGTESDALMMGLTTVVQGKERVHSTTVTTLGDKKGRESVMSPPPQHEIMESQNMGSEAPAKDNAHLHTSSPSDPDSLDAAVVHATNDTVLESARAIRRRLESSMKLANEPDQFETTASSSDSTVPPQPLYIHDNVNMAHRATINWHPDAYWEEPRRHLVCDLARHSDHMSISLVHVAQASIQTLTQPSPVNLQQLTNAAACAAANANNAAKGLSAIMASIILATSTFESKMTLATTAFGEQMKEATESLTTQVQASEMRIQNATDAATASLKGHVDTLNAALREEYNHLFGQLSGHVYTSVNTTIEEKVDRVSATITAMVDGAWIKNAAATKTFDNESVKAHSSLSQALTSVKSCITATADEATPNLEMEHQKHVLSLQDEAGKLTVALVSLHTRMRSSNTADDNADSSTETTTAAPPRILEDPDPANDADVEDALSEANSESPSSSNNIAALSHPREGVWHDQFIITQTGTDRGFGRGGQMAGGRSQETHGGPGRGHYRPVQRDREPLTDRSSQQDARMTNTLHSTVDERMVQPPAATATPAPKDSIRGRDPSPTTLPPARPMQEGLT